MKDYGHLTLEERERLYALKEQGISLRTIAQTIGRSHASLSRELKRNAKYGKEYIPCKAHQRSVKRGATQRHQAPLKNTTIILYVRERLRLKWSPETIAGRLQIDYPEESIDDETIYRYIYHPKNKRRKLWKQLTHARCRRMKKEGRYVKRNSRIPDAVSIDRRPKSIERRVHAGHWEGDNMEGVKRDKTAVSASVERLTRVTVLSKVIAKKADSKASVVTYRLGVFPKRFRKTMTVDNGSENTYHKEVKQQLDMNVYFCHAYHSWEKPTVENTIGRLRRYIPKGTSVDEVSENQLKTIEDAMNNTPRKCLGFLTPYEKKLQVLKRRVK